MPIRSPLLIVSASADAEAAELGSSSVGSLILGSSSIGFANSGASLVDTVTINGDFSGGPIELTAVANSFDLLAVLETAATNGSGSAAESGGFNSRYVGSADFSGSIGLLIPDGFRFSSDAGVLLSAAPAPEPSALSMLCAGLVGLLIAGRGRRS